MRELAIFVRIKCFHNFIRKSLGCTLIEVSVLLEVCFCIKHHFNILMKVFPSYCILIAQVFAIDAKQLSPGVLCLSVAVSSLVNDFDLATTLVSVLSLVGLRTSFLFGVS